MMKDSLFMDEIKEICETNRKYGAMLNVRITVSYDSKSMTLG